MKPRFQILEKALSDKNISDAEKKDLLEQTKKTIHSLPLPRIKNLKPLKGTNPKTFRLRIGDFRVLFFVSKDLISITRISRRPKAYK